MPNIIGPTLSDEIEKMHIKDGQHGRHRETSSEKLYQIAKFEIAKNGVNVFANFGEGDGRPLLHLTPLDGLKMLKATKSLKARNRARTIVIRLARYSIAPKTQFYAAAKTPWLYHRDYLLLRLLAR